VESRTNPHIVVVGAGAVGCYFGGMLAKAGEHVTLIGRPEHVGAIVRDGLVIERGSGEERIPVAASSEIAAVADADVALVTAKSVDTEDVARALVPHLRPSSLVVSLQNGVDNVERIHAASGMHAAASVVYVAVERAGPGRVKHNARGDLVLGELPGHPVPGGRDALECLAARFVRAGVPCPLSDNVQGELWAKLAINCAYNALSALGQARYGRIIANPPTRELARELIRESIAVGRAAGVVLPAGDLVEIGMEVGKAMSNQLSSTAQDIARGKRTEIDSLNGYVARKGAELAVPTPVNTTLHALVKLLETRPL
jgi:2-dehydropantoate 2-reductase